jgi:hypothetical protein
VNENKGKPGIAKKAAWFGLAVFLLTYLLISLFVEPSRAVFVRDSFYIVMGIITISVLIAAAIKSRGPDKRIWTLLALAGALWATGDFTLRICEVTGIFGSQRVLCVPDIFYFSAYVALVMIVVSLGRSSTTTKTRINWVKFYPSAVVFFSIAIGVIMAIFLPRGIAGGSATAAPFDISSVVNYIYTALDICIVAGLLLIILLNRPHFNKPWFALGILGLMTFTVADLSYSLFKPAGIYDPTNAPTQMILALWLTGYGLLSIAAVYKITETSST